VGGLAPLDKSMLIQIILVYLMWFSTAPYGCAQLNYAVNYWAIIIENAWFLPYVL